MVFGKLLPYLSLTDMVPFHFHLLPEPMKYLLLALLTGLLACSSPGSDETGNTGQTEGTGEMSAEFKAFTDQFPVEIENKTYNDDWFADYQEKPDKKELSSADAAQFVHGRAVINHQFEKGSPAEYAIPTDKTYYAVGRITSGSKYITLIVTDMAADNTQTYLLNYTNEGQYVSGIILHAARTVKKDSGEEYYSRKGGVNSENKSLLMVEDAIPGQGSPITKYVIEPDGKIRMQ